MEELYADLDYPQEIFHLVRYRPNEAAPRRLCKERSTTSNH
ncbi:MAG: hypothetical protein KA436_11480 [Oligoflexales bacterium]|nr:hypothetical protein [Oligoflexales bacterium]